MSGQQAVKSVPEPTPTQSKSAANARLLQRRCACGGAAGAGGECQSCAEKRALGLQRKGGGNRLQGLPASVEATFASPGRSLDSATRGFMEQRFGADFGGVRVHDDARAARSARDVDAQAYTVGQDIVFGQGQYQPHGSAGRLLLAHELAHTLQQRGLQRSGLGNLADQGPEYRRLEHEADHAAERVMASLPLRADTFSRGGPRLSRKPASPPADAEQDAPKPFQAHYTSRTYHKAISITTAEQPKLKTGTDLSADPVEYVVDKLVLPPQKGPYAVALCNRPYRPLKAEFIFRGRPRPTPGSNKARDSTAKLRRSWLSKTDYKPGKEADQRWRDVGGAHAFPRIATGPTCEIDHIQELQVGGDNEPENLQVLDKIDNGSSGNLIQQELAHLAGLAFTDAHEQRQAQAQGKKAKRPTTVRLEFGKAIMEGSAQCNLCCQLAKRFVDPNVTAESAKAAGPVMLEYDLIILGNTMKLKLPADKSRSVPLADSSVAENKAVGHAIKGLTLETFERGARNRNRIRASFDSGKFNLKPPTRRGELILPIEPDGTLKLPSGRLGRPVHFEYRKLSTGEFRSLNVRSGGITAEGTLHPSVPFLPRLDVAISNESFRVTKGLDKNRLRRPFHGLRFTKAELALELAPTFKPVGTVEFEVGPEAKPVARGVLGASADSAGLLLNGNLFVYLPGVDEAKGTIAYQGGAWSGGAHIEASRIKLPYIKSGAVDVQLQTHRLSAAGTVALGLPGGNEADMRLRYARERWEFTGHGRIKVRSPYLKPIDAWISYDGERLYAKGRAGFAFRGLDGHVEATYINRDGREHVYGKGTIDIDKGRAKGSITVELHPNHRITGSGHLSYTIKEGLVASAGITVDEHQKITFDGELTFPDITLFPRFPRGREQHKIFEASGHIPIPGASIGPIGLEVQLWGGLYYYYYVGPGVLKDIRANAQFSPFEENPDFRFALHAKASIPAGGGITGKIGADVVLSAYVAEVGGGLSVFATADLAGEAALTSDIAYAKDRFTVDASAYIGGRVTLEAGLQARVFAEAGVWRFKVRTEKDWTLAKTDFDTGLQLGVRLPLHYDSVEGFRMPSLSSIKPEPARLDLDPSRMLSNLFDRARTSKHKS